MSGVTPNHPYSPYTTIVEHLVRAKHLACTKKSRLCRRFNRIQTRLMAGGSADTAFCLPLLTCVKLLGPDIASLYAPSLLMSEVINKASSRTLQDLRLFNPITYIIYSSPVKINAEPKNFYFYFYLYPIDKHVFLWYSGYVLFLRS